MPLYEYECPNGHSLEIRLPLSEYNAPQTCFCGSPAQRVITKPAYGFASRDICYDSPIDGTPITSLRARANDLAKHDCIPYDPEMRKDAARNRERSQRELERKIDETVEAEIERMPSRKREQLASELSSGADVTIERSTL